MLHKVWEYLMGAAILCALAWWGYSSWVVKPAQAERRAESRAAEDAQRFKDWAYVAKEKEIRPGETVKLVIVPHPWGGEFMDTKCLIYTNQEFKQASMICPDADKEFIAEKE